ncbi:MAG: response regulator [Chloroflexota bacterium]|nr:response regulator [Chloroflexota bacterium]
MDEHPTVMVVEDSDHVRDVLTLFLEDEGYKVVPVENGEDALLMGKRLLPALITLDLGLPHLDGREILSRLRSDPETAGIPVLIVSAQLTTELEAWTNQRVAYVGKPFEFTEIQRKVEDLLSG